jgi:hypothetical protein
MEDRDYDIRCMCIVMLHNFFLLEEWYETEVWSKSFVSVPDNKLVYNIDRIVIGR